MAGENRPKNDNDFKKNNVDFTKLITSTLIKYNKSTPIIFSSSTQASLDNLYGQSKLKAEDIILSYGKTNNAKVFIYRLPSVFGKWCRPNYNSVVATICHSIVNDNTYSLNKENPSLSLVYIDDVCKEFIKCISDNRKIDKNNYYEISNIYNIKLFDLEKNFEL